MAANVIDKDLGLKLFLAELEQAKFIETVIGVQQGSMNGKDDIANYAAANEFGTDKIPERSFMRSAFDENASKIAQKLDEEFVITSPVVGKNIRLAFGRAGERFQDSIKKKIGSNIQPQNNPKTIKRKKSTRTLIDTSSMLNSIRWIIRGRTP